MSQPVHYLNGIRLKGLANGLEVSQGFFGGCEPLGSHKINMKVRKKIISPLRNLKHPRIKHGWLSIGCWLSIGWWFPNLYHGKMVGNHHFHPLQNSCLELQVVICCILGDEILPSYIPRCSMYGIFTYIYPQNYPVL